MRAFRSRVRRRIVRTAASFSASVPIREVFSISDITRKNLDAVTKRPVQCNREGGEGLRKLSRVYLYACQSECGIHRDKRESTYIHVSEPGIRRRVSLRTTTSQSIPCFMDPARV